MGKAWQVVHVAVEPARISVIIPCYNLGSFVDKAIDSALSQSVKPADVVVVDNGSEDDSWSVIARYRDAVKTVRIHPNKGVSCARNAGAKEAAGNWFLFLDADDYLNDDALKALTSSAESGGSGVVFGGISQYDVETQSRSSRNSRGSAGEPPLPASKGFWRSAIATPGAAIVHRSVHEAIGGFEKPWQPTEDRDYWLKCGVTTSFRYCEHDVLTKLRRSESMRVFSDWMPLWGMRVQLEFLDWCDERGIDTAFLNVQVKNIVDSAIRRARENGHHDVMEELIRFCGKRGLSTFELHKLKLYQRARRLIGTNRE